MKTKRTSFTTFCCLLIAVLFFCPDASANGEPKSDPNKKKENVASYTFQVKNTAERCKMIDSALIVLDKYDLTGAGAVVRIVAIGPDQQIELSDVPAGKYYASIYTYGMHREQVSTVINVKFNPKKKKANKMVIRFHEGETYTLGQAFIPAEDTKLFAFLKF